MSLNTQTNNPSDSEVSESMKQLEQIMLNDELSVEDVNNIANIAQITSLNFKVTKRLHERFRNKDTLSDNDKNPL